MNQERNSTAASEAESVDSVRISKFIPASPERVFAAWTDPDELRQWWGPKNVRCTSAQVDLRPGGHYRIANKLEDGTVLWISGEFLEIRQPELLAYTWLLEGSEPLEERVTIRFNACDGGTELTVQHDRIPNQALRDQHTAGWQGCLDGLTSLLAADAETN